MAKKSKRPNKAKSLVAQPLFRSRQEQAKKGKGSYRRGAAPKRGGYLVFEALKSRVPHQPQTPTQPPAPPTPPPAN